MQFRYRYGYGYSCGYGYCYTVTVKVGVQACVRVRGRGRVRVGLASHEATTPDTGLQPRHRLRELLTALGGGFGYRFRGDRGGSVAFVVGGASRGWRGITILVGGGAAEVELQ